MAQGKQSLLIGLGVVVALAVGLLAWKVRSSDEPAPTGTPAVADRERPVPPRQVETARPVPGTETQPPPEEDASVDKGYREYTTADGKIVRDHRTGDHPQVTLAPGDHPPLSPRIKATTTRAVSEQVRAIVKACSADVPPEARGDKPRAEGKVLISVASGRVTVTKATFSLTAVVGAAQEPTKACIESKTAAITADVTDEIDITDYAISMNYAIL